MIPILDTEFLRQLDSDRNRTVYARIISLNQYEHPIEQIEGVVTAGSITIDGESAVRRICSLTLSTQNLNINNVYWGITTKVKIEIGLQNNINSDYESIIWFRQGIFILSDFKTTQTTNNYTITLQGKDKMCLLNGDVGGSLPAPTRFDSYVDAAGSGGIVDSSGCYKFSSNLEQIEQELQRGFQQRYFTEYNFIRNIGEIISLSYKPIGDLPEGAKIIFNNNSPVKLLDVMDKYPDKNGWYNINIPGDSIVNFAVTGCILGDKFNWALEQKVPITIIIQEMIHQYGSERFSNIVIKDIDHYALEMVDNNSDNSYYLLHQETGYSKILTEDILKADYQLGDGSAITDPENQIISLDYVDEDNNSLIDDVNNYTRIYNKETNEGFTVKILKSKEVAGHKMTLLVYPDELIGDIGESITSILDKIVSMLGQYEYFYDLDGRFIFQAKPGYINIPWNKTFYLKDDNYVDPGEISKQVAYTFDDARLNTQYQNTPNMNNVKNDFIIWGERKTSNNTMKFHGRYAIDNIPLEYTDFYGYTWVAKESQFFSENLKNRSGQSRRYAFDEVFDWRQLIYVMQQDWYAHNHDDDYEVRLRENNHWSGDGLDFDLYPYGRTGYEQYYQDLEGFWTTLYNANAIEVEYLSSKILNLYTPNTNNYFRIQSRIESLTQALNNSNYYSEGNYKYWAKEVKENPQALIFWFDFFEADLMGLGKFATSVIGDRPKTINDSNIKVIIYRDAPDVIYCTADEKAYYEKQAAIKEGYSYIVIDEDKKQDFFDNLSRSIRGRSVHEEAENMLYQYGHYNDTVSINSVPIYYLEPNKIVSIKDELSKIIGYYIMTKITSSLNYNGTMSIAAIKAPERLY